MLQSGATGKIERISILKINIILQARKGNAMAVMKCGNVFTA
jgi:hypothetical protein